MKLFTIFILSTFAITSFAGSLNVVRVNEVTQSQGEYVNSTKYSLSIEPECFTRIVGTLSQVSDDGIWTIGVLSEELPKEGVCKDSFYPTYHFEMPAGAPIKKVNILGLQK